MAAFSIVTHCLFTALFVGCTQSKHIKVHDLDALTTANHHDIFTPLLSNLGSFSHDIFVEDAFGKFMKLKYKATHPADSAFIKLDGMKSDIESIDCLEDDTNTIELQMANSKAAESMYQSVSEHLSLFPSHHEDGGHFITGSYQWLCRDKYTQRFSPLMRRITSVEMDSKSADTVVFTTEYASYPDLFENLDLEFVSNAKLYHSENTTSTIVPRRRLGDSWWSDLWDDICEGVDKIIDHVTSWIDDLNQFAEDLYYGVEDAIEVIEGKTVSRNGTENFFWSYNYDSDSDRAKESFYLDKAEHVECTNCYIWYFIFYMCFPTNFHFPLESDWK